MVRYVFKTIEMYGLSIDVVVEHWPGTEPCYAHGGEPGSTEVEIEGAHVEDGSEFAENLLESGLISEAIQDWDSVDQAVRTSLVRKALRAWHNDIEDSVSED